ncbi:TPA: hypothetical protein ACJGSF_005201 [Salmonella enterica subsp. enterica serovar Muenchen]|nr:hypothetical protein [Salmonella enterica]
MKKLIIAAGIAAAMASFGASAAEAYSPASTASFNTVVKASSSLVVGAESKEVLMNDFLHSGTEIGSFQVKFNGDNSEKYTDILVEKIHTHGFPDGFKIQLAGGATNCDVTTGVAAESAANVTGKGVANTCDFVLADAAKIVVKTNQDTESSQVVAGTKTITAQFRAYHA